MNEHWLRSIDESCRERFEAVWLRGEVPSLDDFLPDRDSPTYLPTLEELVSIDLEFRWKRWLAGQVSPGDTAAEFKLSPPSLADYTVRFSELTAPEIQARLEAEAAALRNRHVAAAESSPAESPEEPTSNASTQAGDVLGRYAVIEEKGRGGFGIVWVADDEKLGRKVAVKQLAKDLTQHPEIRQRFVREARVTSRLQHPGIVPIHDVSDDGDDEQVFYAMKLVEGDTLDEVIDAYHAEGGHSQRKQVELLRLLNTFLSIVRTMDYAHSNGVVHRDLKPQNVIVGRFGETIVLDWGLAKDLNLSRSSDDREVRESGAVDTSAMLTRAGTIQGTPAYMSPEQAAGNVDAIGPYTDVFALGGILFQILTGTMPFEGSTATELIQRVQFEEIRSPRAVNRKVSRPLDAICRKATARDVRRRYATAGELADDLERYLADEPVSAWSEPVWTRAARYARRHRLAVAMLAATLLFACAAAGIVYSAAQRRQQQEERHENQIRNRESRRLAELESKVQALLQLADAELANDQYVSAHRLYLNAEQSIRDEESMLERLGAVRDRRQRLQQIVEFYRYVDRAEELVYFDRVGEARALLQIGIDRLGVWDHVDWWARLPAEDLTPVQLDKLQQDVFRELHLLWALRLFQVANSFLTDREAINSAHQIARCIQRFRPSFSVDCGEKFLAPAVGTDYELTLPPGYRRTTADNLCLGSVMWGISEEAAGPQVALMKQYTGISKPMETAGHMLERAALGDPEHYWTHVFLARSQDLRGNHEAARGSCQLCVAIRPDYYFSYLFRASILIEEVKRRAAAGETQTAEFRDLLRRTLTDLDIARDLRPGSPEVYRRRSYIHSFDSTMTPQAVSDCVSGILLEPELSYIPDSHNRKVRGYYARDLVDYSQRLHEQEPEQLRWRMFQAWAAWYAGKHGEAAQFAQQVSDAGQFVVEAELVRRLAQSASRPIESVDKAAGESAVIADARRASDWSVSTDDRFFQYWVHHQAGADRLRDGQLREAVDEFQASIDYSPNAALMHRSREYKVAAMLRQGPTADAWELLERMKTDNPAHFPALVHSLAEERQMEQILDSTRSWKEILRPVVPQFTDEPTEPALLNRGFELGMARHWGDTEESQASAVWANSAGSESSATASPAAARSGKLGLLIRHETALAAGVFGGTSQVVPVRTGDRVQLSAWMKGRGDSEGAVQLILSSGEQETAAGLPAAAADWRKISCTLEATVPWVVVTIRSVDRAEVLLDDLSLVRVHAPE